MRHLCSFCNSAFDCNKDEEEHTKYELQEAILFCGEDDCLAETFVYSPWMLHSKEKP